MAVFEGEVELVEELIEFCRIGSPQATVKNIEVKWEAFTGIYSDLAIIQTPD